MAQKSATAEAVVTPTSDLVLPTVTVSLTTPTPIPSPTSIEFFGDEQYQQLSDYLRDEHGLGLVRAKIDGNYAFVMADPIDGERSQSMFLKFEKGQWQELPIMSGEPHFPPCNQLIKYGVPQSLYGECTTCEEMTDAWRSSGGFPADRPDIQEQYCQ